MSRDAWLMVTARTLRTFAQTSISVFFAIYLEAIGYSVGQIGLLVTVGGAGSSLFAFLVVFFGNALGRRKLLMGFTLLMGLAGLGFAMTEHYLTLALVTFFVGSLAISGSGPRGPIQPLEMASLPDTTTAENRTNLFALSSVSDRLARFFGALAASLPALFVIVFGITQVQGFKIMFVGYTVLMLASALMYWRLSPAVEQRSSKRRITNPFTLPSRRRIFTLAAVLSTDSFATRFTFFSLVALWFSTRFGFEIEDVSFLLAATTIVSIGSPWLAAWLSNRIGLLNTIVFTHIPAVAFTFMMPFAPWAWLAVAMYVMRGFFSPMDTAPRNSYTMAIVNREERAAMAGISNVSQSTVGVATPWLSTMLWEVVHISAPFFAAGVMKSVYLTGMFLTFRNVRPPEEEARRVGNAGVDGT